MRTTTLALAAIAFVAGYSVRSRKNRLQAAFRGEKGIKTRALYAGTALVQNLTPVEQFNLYLDGFHFESGNMDYQIRACHYCTPLTKDITQCVIFDQNGPDARLIGVEYIISQRLFEALPEEEKVLWHSHMYEVNSGQLVAPGVPVWAETQLAGQLKTTYGKIWHTWDTVLSKIVPLGIPKLMMGFTADGQIHPDMLAERDRLLDLSTARRRAHRAGVASLPVAEGANAWEHGEVVQIELARTGMTYRDVPKS